MVSARSVQSLPDTDQQSRGERDRQAARVSQRAQPDLRILVRAAVVSQALGLEQPPRRGLQHHAHRRRHRLEPGQLRPAHDAGVQMRQQTGLLQHPDGHRPHVVQRRIVATLVEPLPGLVPPRLRPVTERKQRLLATQFGTATRHLEDLVGLHVHAGALRPQLAGNRDERAVVAGVAAQMGDGNEHLARVTHRQPSGGSAAAGRLEASITHSGGAGAQVHEVIPSGGHRDRGFFDIECYAVACSSQHATQARGTGGA